MIKGNLLIALRSGLGKCENRRNKSMIASTTPPYYLDRGLLKVAIAAFISLYLGGKLAKKGASFLEENEIFVHSDDSDE